MTTIENEEEIIQRGYNVIIENPEWMEYVKTFNKCEGFLWTNDSMLYDIKDAIYLDNPLHSAASLAVTINRCNYLLNN
jgi:hypothetical protein